MNEELLKIAEPNTEEDDTGQVKAKFYLNDLTKKIESEKTLMADKIWEEIIRYADNQRKKLGLS